LHNLITKIHTLKDDATIEKYNQQIAKLGEINQLLFSKQFPYITDSWITGDQLDKNLLQPFDLLHVVVERKHRGRGFRQRRVIYTDLYCYQQDLGGVIIRVPGILELKVKQIPMIYKIILNPNNSRFKILDTSIEDKQYYYARAIIQAKSKNHIIVKRIFPEIFGKFFED
ncbi:MAG: hypothetical protein ACTSYB_09185, partial [Candidatus Helarchaeota archaeon]